MSDVVCISITPGTTFRQGVTASDSNGAPIDLTGYTFVWFIDVIGPVTYTTAPEVVVDEDPTTGKLELVLSPTQTAVFTRIRGYHYLRATPPSGGDVVDFIEGSVDVDVRC